jgi:hypothetical protein
MCVIMAATATSCMRMAVVAVVMAVVAVVMTAVVVLVRAVAALATMFMVMAVSMTMVMIMAVGMAQVSVHSQGQGNHHVETHAGNRHDEHDCSTTPTTDTALAASARTASSKLRTAAVVVSAATCAQPKLLQLLLNVQPAAGCQACLLLPSTLTGLMVRCTASNTSAPVTAQMVSTDTSAPRISALW